MKIALILPNNVWFCPYVAIYTDLLNKTSVDYDIISWNRDGVKENAIQYDAPVLSHNPIILMRGYIGFAKFVRKVVLRNSYDSLIVFSPQSAIFLSSFLKRHFAGRYIFDYRDLSIEQNLIFKLPFRIVLANSYVNVVSSPGFLKWLPRRYSYLLSHNFDINVVRDVVAQPFRPRTEQGLIDVLTIGGIRDYESNVEIIKGLANADGISLRFVGKGPSAASLKEAVVRMNACNVSFEGYYPKEKEHLYIASCTFMNIFYPRRKSHDTALSNRFYNALIHKKPMIVTSDTIQGDYATSYGVGIALTNCEGLNHVLRNYIETLDDNEFQKNCNRLLNDFISDYEKWESVVKAFIKN